MYVVLADHYLECSVHARVSCNTDFKTFQPFLGHLGLGC